VLELASLAAGARRICRRSRRRARSCPGEAIPLPLLVGDLEFVELLTIAQVRLLPGWRNESGFLAEVGAGLGVPVPVLPHQSEANRRIREQPTGMVAQARARGGAFFLEQGRLQRLPVVISRRGPLRAD